MAKIELCFLYTNLSPMSTTIVDEYYALEKAKDAKYNEIGKAIHGIVRGGEDWNGEFVVEHFGHIKFYNCTRDFDLYEDQRLGLWKIGFTTIILIVPNWGIKTYKASEDLKTEHEN